MTDTRRPNRRDWAKYVTQEQKDTIRQIRRSCAGAHKPDNSDGWSLYGRPSVGQLTYCELRHYMGEGHIAKWVIERDGTVSATNRQGRLSELEAVA